jgi:hypothetical membrane protein
MLKCCPIFLHFFALNLLIGGVSALPEIHSPLHTRISPLHNRISPLRLRGGASPVSKNFLFNVGIVLNGIEVATSSSNLQFEKLQMKVSNFAGYSATFCS